MPACAAPRPRVLPVAPAPRNAPRRRLSGTGLYHEVGGDGSNVALVHAGVCDSRMWEPQWETFPRAHRTLRYDLRGFGRSPLMAPAIEHARDLIELLAHVGFERTSLVGVSLGGRVALEVAAARPDLVESLVLVGPPLPGHDWSDEMQAFDAAEEEAVDRGDLDGAAELNVRMWVDGARRGPDGVDAAVRELVREMTRRSFELQLAVPDARMQWLVPDVADRLGEIPAPTLVVVGAEDAVDMHRIGERLEREMPDARRITLAGAAHLPSLERPAEFDALVLPFLAGR